MAEAVNRLLRLLPLPGGYQRTAQGCYRYFLNGQLQAITEPWVQATNPEGQLLTHSARVVDALQACLLVTHQHSPVAPDFAQNAGQPIRLPGDFHSEICWQQAGHADIRATYQFNERERRLHRMIAHDAGFSSAAETRPLPLLYFPLLRIFSGPVIQNLATQGPLPTLVPDINNPGNRATLLHPTEHLRSAERLGSEVIEMGGQHYSLHRYHYASERYQPEDDAAFWIDNHGLLAKYRWQQSPDHFWQVELHEHQFSTPSASETPEPSNVNSPLDLTC